MQPLKILFLSAEVTPFGKVGGLADVCGSLPKALAHLGHDVRIVMPAFAPVEAALHSGKHGVHAHPATLQVNMGQETIYAGVFQAHLPGSNVPAYFIAERQRFGDRPYFYGYRDDPFRFSFFCRAALDLVVAHLNWRPDVVHAHDWHTAPAIAWLDTAGQGDSRFAKVPTLYTIHNLMHQGHSPWEVFDYLGLFTHRLAEEGYGEVNFMARGIYHATMVSTVSPTYAREVMTPEGGSGLDKLLRHRHLDVHGILNGLDIDVWDPATDRHLPAPFDRERLDERRASKRALQARAGLPQRDDVPLVAMVSRLDLQKGLDITGHVLHLLMNDQRGEAQCVILGAGASYYEDMLRHLAGYHRDRMTAFLGYDPELAPLIYGGSDIFLMPSLFEPCGLGQLIAMRYGSVPVVRATGGLVDTVQPGETGFTFAHYTSADFWNALQEALALWRADPVSWRAMQERGMARDFSWQASARAYEQVYEWAIARVRGY